MPALLLALALLFAGASLPVQPSVPMVRTAGPPAPADICATSDQRLTELSGLVAGATGGPGRFAITDGGRRVQVHELAPDCTVRRTITARVDPYDGDPLPSGWNTSRAASIGWPSSVTRPLTGASSGPLSPQPIRSDAANNKGIAERRTGGDNGG